LRIDASSQYDGTTGYVRRHGDRWIRRLRQCSVAPLSGVRVESRPRAGEADLVERLRDRDERAFEHLVESYYPAMVALARVYVRSAAVIEEVVQEAWLGVLKGLDRFEGRSSLRTWVLQIVANVARTRALREARSVPFSSLAAEGGGPSVEPERFRGPDDPYPGHWRSYPTDWRTIPEQKLLSDEALTLVKQAIEQLPERQQLVITLRDVAGCSSQEVCETLGLSDGNERVLLHRARAAVRAALERYVDG
jgi:RNA polymerase sigma-70 factor (ECF subfamily)